MLTFGKGILSLLLASAGSIRVLEYSPLSMDSFEHPDLATAICERHICSILLGCPRLEDLTISIPTLCPEIFSNHELNWSGDLQIRAAGLCGRERAFMNREEGSLEFSRVLNSARSLIAAQAEREISLSIEIFIGECSLPYKSAVGGASILIGNLQGIGFSIRANTSSMETSA